MILPELAAAHKRLARPIVWEEKGRNWHVSRPQIHGIKEGVEGLYLRIRSPMRLDRAGFMIQVEYQPALRRSTQQLDRLEWRAAHTNSNCGPLDLRLLEIESTHWHAFDLNYLRDENRMRHGNLPLARAIEPDPDSLQAFLAFAGKALRIKGLESVEPPRVQRTFEG